MKRNFDRALAHVLRYEGGYVDHPSDPGGATNMGITRKTLARWRHISPWWKLPKLAVKQLAQREVAAIYLTNYWAKGFCTKLPDGLDFYVFDYAVNSGPRRAVTSLQNILRVVADGHIGPKTLAAVRKADTSDLINGLDKSRMRFLKHLSIFKIFGNGWTARLTATKQSALALVALKPPSCNS